jgi:hypothetical protein
MNENIIETLHGDLNMKIIKNIIKKILSNYNFYQYDYIWASRTIVKNGQVEKGNLGFYKEDLWTIVGEQYFKNRLYKGETIYG